mmetsp:Transcript_81639/g.205437  ORF Transcript_81639/g.205437 Transcript_81639/m.205437 type:complete len:201 (+) Transcript_81639:2722-3324(+)
MELDWLQNRLFSRKVLEAREGDLIKDVVQNGGRPVGLEIDSRSNIGIEVCPTLELACDLDLRSLHESIDVACESQVQTEVGLKVRLVQPHETHTAREDVLELWVPGRVRIIVPIPTHVAHLLWGVQVEHAVVVCRGVGRDGTLEERFWFAERGVVGVLRHAPHRCTPVLLPRLFDLSRSEGVLDGKVRENLGDGRKLLRR